MKAELKELLESKDGKLEINSMFTLRRWILDPDTDIIGRSGDHLIIEMNNRYKSHRDIKSRNTKGIMEEVSKYMMELMDEYKEDLVRRFEGGQIGKYL